ncbi:MAG: hypothetical protein ACI4XJ_02340 [Eubacteriales bacterium]
MRAYYNSLVVMMVVTAAACFLSPSAELTKKNVRPVCGLLLLLTLVSPISSAVQGIESMDFSRFSTSAESEQLYAPQAYAILKYISDEYGSDGSRVVFITDEEGSLLEIQLFTAAMPYGTKEAIVNSLEGEYGCEVRIYCGEE